MMAVAVGPQQPTMLGALFPHNVNGFNDEGEGSTCCLLCSRPQDVHFSSASLQCWARHSNAWNATHACSLLLLFTRRNQTKPPEHTPATLLICVPAEHTPATLLVCITPVPCTPSFFIWISHHTPLSKGKANLLATQLLLAQRDKLGRNEGRTGPNQAHQRPQSLPHSLPLPPLSPQGSQPAVLPSSPLSLPPPSPPDGGFQGCLALPA